MAKLLTAFLFLILAQLSASPEALYLTWVDHPESSVVVSWLSTESKEGNFQFKVANADEWFEVKASQARLEKLPRYILNRVELNGLSPDTKYQFHLPSEDSTYVFSTLPATLSSPLKFVVGGDIYHDQISLVEEMNSLAALEDPHFALLGGDIAYTGSGFSFLNEDAERWIDFLKAWSKTMVKSDGSLIPMTAAIGNHDVNGRFDQTEDKARLFYQLFLPGNRSYRTIDFGNYLSFFILDSSHTAPIQGNQTAWLNEALKERKERKWKFALYHVPAYPSVRAYSGIRSAKIRKHWVPLFEKYHLDAAFENHDHAYKRSHPILNGAVDPQGVLYIGDGSWGVEKPRTPRSPAQSWYIAKSKAARQVLFVTVKQDGVSYESIDSKGERIDSFSR